jgi:hypothetical protein
VRAYRWAWLVLTALALLGFAQATRYELVGQEEENADVVYVWDRWRHRLCIAGLASDPAVQCGRLPERPPATSSD